MPHAALESTPYVWPMLAATAIVGGLTFYSWHRRSVPGARTFAAVMLLSLPWALGSVLEMTAVDFADKVFWVKFQRIWALPLVSGSLWFALDYATLHRWMRRPTLIALSIAPLIVLILIVTNDRHHLMWRGFWLDTEVRYILGPAAWVFVDYGLVITVLSCFVFLWLFLQSPFHRWPAALFLGGHLATRLAYLLDVMGVNPVAPMDPTMVVHAGASGLYAFALFRLHMFDLVPVAYGTVIEQMREGMIILDREYRIVHLNAAAAKFVGIRRAECRGARAVDILRVVPDIAEWLGHHGSSRREFSVGSGTGLRHCTALLSPLEDRHGLTRGHMIMLRDVTDTKRANDQMVGQERALATLEERNRLARELHDDLGQVLGYLKMEAQTARQMLARDRTSEVDGTLARIAAVAQEAHVGVREYIAGARAWIASNGTFVSALEHHIARFRESSGIPASVHGLEQLRECPVDPDIGGHLLRIIQEALTNVRKHAGAREVHIHLRVVGREAEVVVHDDGAGFDPAVFADAADHFGLDLMNERAAAVGGRVQIRSAPGRGTEIVVHAPLRKE